MSFSQKFDLLLRISGTSNSALAKYMSLDPSYISRLRNGQRSMPGHEEYYERFAAFLVRQCVSDLQRQALCQAIGEAGKDPFGDCDRLQQRVASWLRDNRPTSTTETVGRLLTDFSRVATGPPPKPRAAQKEDGVLVFHGEEGRRQASIALLNRAALLTEPATLLLYSDEHPSWMTDHPSFSYEWADLLWRIIQQGGAVRVIHKISSDLDEMLGVIRQWLPFYASGAIEPYYYPKLRDGVYKRTLSVVPGAAAVFATSIGSQESASTFLTTDSTAVDSFTNEFSSYLALCRPLLRIHTDSTESYRQVLQTYSAHFSSSILRCEGLPMATIPDQVLRSVAERCGLADPKDYCGFYGEWRRHLEATLEEHQVCHILRLDDPEKVVQGKALLHSVYPSQQQIYYTPREYRRHLKEILRLLRRYPGYTVLPDEGPSAGYSLHTFEDGEVYILKNAQPSIIFHIVEPNMASAFWDFQQYHRDITGQKHSREVAMARIESLVASLAEL